MVTNSYYLFRLQIFKYNLWSWILIYLDVLFGLVAIFNVIRAQIIQSMMSTVVALYQLYMMNHISKIMKTLQLQLQVEKRQYFLPSAMILLKQIYDQHTRLCIYHAKTSKEFWSSYLGFYFLISIPFNVLLVFSLTMNLGIGILAFVVSTLIMHTSFTLLPLILSAAQSKQLHMIRGSLVPISKTINCRNIVLKLKYSDLFDRLTHGRKYGQYMESIGTLTYYIIYKVYLKWFSIDYFFTFLIPLVCLNLCWLFYIYSRSFGYV